MVCRPLNSPSRRFDRVQSTLLLYCRAGFEPECAAEIQSYCAALGLKASATGKPESAYVPVALDYPDSAAPLLKRIQLSDLVFARQLLFHARLFQNLPTLDRVTPLVSALRESGLRYSELLLETADTNAGKALSAFCRKFAPPLEHALAEADLLVSDPYAPRLHLLALDTQTIYLGLAYPHNASPWPMGIPRVKFSRAAPSRSALKLAEAFLTFLSEEEEQDLLHEGVSAVDLGAAPGGWTWQLTQRALHVTAVDNGALHAELRGNGLVEHIRADGFRYTPKRPVDWLVCDMVEQPKRVAELVARWLAQGQCRYAIFNLKLPMKKRWEMYLACRDIIEQALEGKAYRMQFKQLYHDRLEITGCVLMQTSQRRKRHP